MKINLFVLNVALIIITFAAGDIVRAQDYLPEDTSISYQPGDNLLAPDELDNLLAPIALYPDPLIAQILPASTFTDQIDEAARYVRMYGKSGRVDDQLWDVSVKAIAHYPDVLFMMDQKYEWTASLGQAYIDQPQDVMDAIQRLRADAMLQGNLLATREQQVFVENGVIRIVPASPEYIYVPAYDPRVVYVERPDPYLGFVTFGIGLTIGAWLSRDCDWHGHRIYYHGWQGEGWVGRSRPIINDRSRTYINRNAGTINVNRGVLQHNTERYRETIRHDVERRREPGGRPAPLPGVPQRGQEVHPVSPPQARPVTPPQARPVAPVPSRQELNNVFRGRDVKGTNPASRTGYGGYGSSNDATVYQERGKSSRQNMQQTTRPSPPASRPSVAPAQRPAMQPAQRPSASGHTPKAPESSGTSSPGGSPGRRVTDSPQRH